MIQDVYRIHTDKNYSIVVIDLIIVVTTNLIPVIVFLLLIAVPLQYKQQYQHHCQNVLLRPTKLKEKG